MGTLVSLFGIFSYIKGEQNGVIIKGGGIPEEIFKLKPKRFKKSASPDITDQLARMFYEREGE